MPVFAQPWYLDAVRAPSEDWWVILYKRDGQILAAFPPRKRKALRIMEPYFIITGYSDKYRLLNGPGESARALKHIVKG